MGRTISETIGEEIKSNRLVKAEGMEKAEEDAESTKEVKTSKRVGGGSRVKKDNVDRKKKAKIRT